MTTKLTFQELFKKFRLRSELDTLHDFGDAMSQERVIYDDTIYSHWQKGNKLPRERQTALAAIRVFTKRNGMTTLKEANLWLESLSMGYLTDEEIATMPSPLRDKAPFLAPKEISNFTGRDEYIKELSCQLMEHKSVLIYGGAGRGKTSLAIKLAYLLRDEFIDGILWYRVDTSTTANILTNMAYIYGTDITNIQDEYMKASVVRSLLSDKKILVILDNVEPHTPIDLLLPTSLHAAVLVTSQSQHIQGFMPDISMGVYGLHDAEVTKLYTSIFSKPFMAKHGKALKSIATKLENNPLAIQIAARQIKRNSRSILHLSERLEKEIAIQDMTYENKNIYTSLDFTFQKLPAELQKIFLSLGVFAGADFSLEAVSFIHNKTQNYTEKKLEKLKEFSLIESSSNDRYRLHPFIRAFIEKQIIPPALYKRTGKYYVLFLKKNKYIFSNISTELENIIAVYNKCYTLKQWEILVHIWLGVKIFLWDMGLWKNVKVMGAYAYEAADKSNSRWEKAYISLTSWGMYNYWHGQPEKAVALMDEALSIAHELGDTFLIAYAQLRLGRYGYRVKSTPTCRALLQKAFSYFSTSDQYHLLSLNYRYFAFYEILDHNYEQTKELFEKAIEVTKKIQVPYRQSIEESINYSYLGLLYIFFKNFSQAKKILLKALDIEDKANINTMTRLWMYLGLGLIDELQNNIPDAILSYAKARNIMETLSIGSNTYVVNYHIVILDHYYQKSPLFNKYIKPLLRETV